MLLRAGLLTAHLTHSQLVLAAPCGVDSCTADWKLTLVVTRLCFQVQSAAGCVAKAHEPCKDFDREHNEHLLKGEQVEVRTEPEGFLDHLCEASASLFGPSERDAKTQSLTRD